MIIIIILNKFKNKMHKKDVGKKSSPVEIRTWNLLPRWPATASATVPLDIREILNI